MIESKIIFLGGFDNYVKDVIKIRRKVIFRGLDYFIRLVYNIRKRIDFEGEEIEERDFIVESENFFVIKGEIWGDKVEVKVYLIRLK